MGVHPPIVRSNEIRASSTVLSLDEGRQGEQGLGHGTLLRRDAHVHPASYVMQTLLNAKGARIAVVNRYS